MFNYVKVIGHAYNNINLNLNKDSCFQGVKINRKPDRGFRFIKKFT